MTKGPPTALLKFEGGSYELKNFHRKIFSSEALAEVSRKPRPSTEYDSGQQFYAIIFSKWFTRTRCLGFWYPKDGFCDLDLVIIHRWSDSGGNFQGVLLYYGMKNNFNS